MQLNPEKCAFNAKARKMLGYLISRSGIKANPSKIHAITEMSPPTNPKEVQHLASRLVALSCFLTKSAEPSLPFFKMLGGFEQFNWTPACQVVFEALQAHLFHLETVTIPLPGEGLLLYLSVSTSAVNIALLTSFAPAKDASGWDAEATSPQLPLQPIAPVGPLAHWGMDLIGPFPCAKGNLQYMVVALEYFFKWVKVEPITTITLKNVQKFFWKNIICHFGVP
ncbi:uncharacterized protein LOC133923105 [Phragmites australis]|uniref:uncharacterized protein LOC133923105 n=1 Tax=Phragmites australis TaxID=29695 RepID=UPI002D780566|nr:uncharacterized protein LOC133923105 [Phragmites australis]